MFTKSRQTKHGQLWLFVENFFSEFLTLLQNDPKKLIADDPLIMPYGKATLLGLFIIFP